MVDSDSGRLARRPVIRGNGHLSLVGGHPGGDAGTARDGSSPRGVELGRHDGRGRWRGQGQQWDVVLSFAGAQRDYVGQVARALRERGVRCFYDADEETGLWGKHLAEELPRIYGEQASAVVVFISAEYAERDWTRLERQAALARAVRERREYVLPAGSMTRRCRGCCPMSSLLTCAGTPLRSSPV